MTKEETTKTFDFLKCSSFSGMAFKTNSGDVILISPEDCKRIANEIIVQGLLDRSEDSRVKLVVRSDKPLDRLKELYGIYLKESGKMPNELAVEYLKEILALSKMVIEYDEKNL